MSRTEGRGGGDVIVEKEAVNFVEKERAVAMVMTLECCWIFILEDFVVVVVVVNVVAAVKEPSD